MAGSDRADNQSLLVALQHSLRRRILRLMEDEEPVSPKELAELMDLSLANVSYHVRVLAQNGAVKPAGKRKVRGATQHFYRWSLDSEWARTVLAETERESADDGP